MAHFPTKTVPLRHLCRLWRRRNEISESFGVCTTIGCGKKTLGPFCVDCTWRDKNPSRRVDVSVRKIESPPWDELRYPGVPTERPGEDSFWVYARNVQVRSTPFVEFTLALVELFVPIVNGKSITEDKKTRTPGGTLHTRPPWNA